MEKKDSPRVAVVVLNWNRPRETIACVRSLGGILYPNLRIVVVDNGSTDDSAARIRKALPGITLLETGANKGYTGGNNAGITHALEEGAAYVLILNNDTTVVEPRFVDEMVAVMESDRDIGILGPRVADRNGGVQRTVLRFPTPGKCLKDIVRAGRREEEADYASPRRVEAVSGVCWLIRSEVFADVGLLDERFFMYVEEQDFCFRAARAGWKVMYVPVPSIRHERGGGDEYDRQRNVRHYVYGRRNTVLFLRKHFGRVWAFFFAALFLCSNTCKVLVSRAAGLENIYTFSLLQRLWKEILHVLGPHAGRGMREEKGGGSR